MPDKKPLIFVIEDNEMYAKTILQRLNNIFEADVEHFLTGADALDNMTAGPDIVVLDYLLKDETGGEVLKGIREQLPNVPVILLRGQSDTQAVQELFELNIYDYIIKRKDAFEKLEGMVEHLLNERNKKGILDL